MFPRANTQRIDNDLARGGNIEDQLRLRCLLLCPYWCYVAPTENWIKHWRKRWNRSQERLSIMIWHVVASWRYQLLQRCPLTPQPSSWKVTPQVVQVFTLSGSPTHLLLEIRRGPCLFTWEPLHSLSAKNHLLLDLCICLFFKKNCSWLSFLFTLTLFQTSHFIS